jgi:hypothetical protein
MLSRLDSRADRNEVFNFNIVCLRLPLLTLKITVARPILGFRQSHPGDNGKAMYHGSDVSGHLALVVQKVDMGDMHHHYSPLASITA